MPPKIPDNELKDWLNYLEDGQEISDITPTETNQCEGSITIDLHNKTVDQSYLLLEKTFALALKHNLLNIEIITGIGKNEKTEFGTLYQEIPKFLEYGNFKSLIKNYNRASTNAGVILVALKNE